MIIMGFLSVAFSTACAKSVKQFSLNCFEFSRLQKKSVK